MAENMLKITLVKSSIGYAAYQRKVLQGLGLRKLHQTVIRQDTPEIRGMINKISHLLKYEQTAVSDEKKKTKTKRGVKS